MAQVRINFQGRSKIETFSRTRIQAMCDRVQFPLGVVRQIGALRQVLTQQAIRILVGAPLPRRMRIGKEHLDREAVCELFMFRHFFAPIIGQRFPQRSGDLPQFLREDCTPP
jgi:hypothetical protein